MLSIGGEGNFSDSIITIFPDSDSEIILKNRLIFGKVKAYKDGADFLGHPVYCHQTMAISFYRDRRHYTLFERPDEKHSLIVYRSENSLVRSVMLIFCQNY